MKYFLKRKASDKKGFTLAELLIVVAIIAVLAMVAIPIFSTKIEHAKEETDIANLRAAKAAAIAFFMDNKDFDGYTLTDGSINVYFDAATGDIVKSLPSIAYGMGTELDGGCSDFPLVVNPSTDNPQVFYEADTAAENSIISITLDGNGYIQLEWVELNS